MKPYAAVALAACAWGTWPLILRQAPMSASLQSAIVMAVFTLVSFPVMRRSRIATPASRMQKLAVAWLGVSDALNIALFFAAYQRTSVAVAVLTHYLTPIFVALAGPFVLRERTTARTLGSALVSFAGLVLLLRPWGQELGASDAMGAAFGAGSAVFYAANTLVTKRVAHVFSAGELMFFHGLVATPLLFLMVPSSAYGAVTGEALVWVFGGALGPGAVAGLVYVAGLRRIPANRAAVLTLLEPLVAVGLARAVLGERLGIVPVLGGVAILLGALAVVTDARKVG